MSMENVKKFMELVQTEEGLAKRMVALKDGLQEGEFNFKNDKEFVEKKILPLAKEYGIEFSVEDFMEFTSSQLTSLSEDELAKVSGGFPGVALLTFLALGIGTIMPSAVQKVTNIVVGSPASTMQSVADKDVGMSDAKTGAIVDRGFKTAKRYLSKQIKDAFNNINSYMSPEARSTWMEENANKEYRGEYNKLTDKKVYAKYDKNEDAVTFTATWDNRLNDFMDTTKYSQAALNGKLSEILQLQYNIAYGSDSTKLLQNWNNLNQQRETQQEEKAGYEAKIKDLTQKNTELQSTVGYCYKQLIAVCDALIQNNSSNHQYKRWKTALESKTFRAWDNLKEKAEKYFFTTENGQTYTYDTYVDTLESTTQQIQDNNQQISQLQYSTQQAQTEINFINTQMQDISTRWQPYVAEQQAFSNNMKTEFDYFYGELVKALKEDEEISNLASSANTTEAKTTLANKIKEKANTIIKDKLNNQLLDGCKIEIDQTELMFNIKVHYNGVGWNNSFSVDEFISAENHMEIVNSESSKKREEIISKIANHVNSTSSSSSDLKFAVQSVFEQIRDKTVNLELGVDITTASSKNITFSFTSGGKTLTTSFGVDAVVNKCNQLKNMQAMEATRQQNEGTIEYTPFGRKLWNSIGSQAQHVLKTIAQIENLSDVKESGAFENDLKYVADRILTQGNSPYGLKGDHHTDTSLKTEDLQKIQEFAAKIPRNDN